MVFQTFFRATGLCLLLFIASASARPSDPSIDLTSLPDADVKTLIVKLERTACYGNCPAYTMTIHGDGRVEYNGKMHVKEKGLLEGRVEADQIKSLADCPRRHPRGLPVLVHEVSRRAVGSSTTPD